MNNDQINQVVNLQDVPESMRDLIKGFLIAPKQTKHYLQKEMGLALILNCLVVIAYVNLLITSSLDSFYCYPILSLWFTSFAVFNGNALICKIIFLPQLFLLQSPRTYTRVAKKQFIFGLRKLLINRIYQWNVYLSQTVLIHYVIGTIFLTFSFISSLIFQSDDCPQDIPIRAYSLELIILFIIKFVFTVKGNTQLEKQKILESQEDFVQLSSYEEEYHRHDCPICLLDFQQGDIIGQFQCPGLHCFHELCIREWLSAKANITRSCPYCKQLPSDYS